MRGLAARVICRGNSCRLNRVAAHNGRVYLLTPIGRAAIESLQKDAITIWTRNVKCDSINSGGNEAWKDIYMEASRYLFLEPIMCTAPLNRTCLDLTFFRSVEQIDLFRYALQR